MHDDWRVIHRLGDGDFARLAFGADAQVLDARLRRYAGEAETPVRVGARHALDRRQFDPRAVGALLPKGTLKNL